MQQTEQGKDTQQNVLAVVIMAFDEAEVLERCLDSLAAFDGGVDIVVSVDDRTQDESAEVAWSHTKHVIQHQGIPDAPVAEPPGTKSIHSLNSMSRLRNDVLDAACKLTSAPFILWLDADEWVESGHDALLAAAREAEDKEAIDGLMVRIEDVLPDGFVWRTWENVKVVRRDLRFERRRHEGVFSPKKHLRVPVILRHCKTASEEHVERRMRQKLDDTAYVTDWLEFRDDRAAYYRGDCLNARGAIADAEVWFSRAMEIGDPRSPQKALAAMKLVGCRFKMGDGWGAREAAFEGLKVDWKRGDFFFDLAQIAAAAGQNEEARHWLRCAALYKGAESVQEMPTEKVEDLPHLMLARVAMAEGDYEEARRELELAQAYGRNRPEFHDLALKLDEAQAPKALERSLDGLVIISGPMRTGTTWLCRAFNRLGRMVMEPVIMAERGFLDREDATVEGKPQCSTEFAQACAEVVAPIRARRGNYDEKTTERLVGVYSRIGEEWPELIGFKEALPAIAARAYPDAQFVLLERSTASVLASIAKRWGPGPDVTPLRDAYPHAWDALLPERYHELAEDDPERRRHEQAVYNVLCNWLDRKELAEVGAEFRVVRFEELTANYHHVLPELLDWLGYDAQEAYERMLPAMKVPPERPAESVEERRLFVQIGAEVEGLAAEMLDWSVAPRVGKPTSGGD